MLNKNRDYHGLHYDYTSEQIKKMYLVVIGLSVTEGFNTLMMSHPTVFLSSMELITFSSHGTYINLLFNQFSHGSCAILGKYRIFESYEEALNFKKRFLRIYDKYINNIIKQNRDELTELKKTHTWL